MPFYSLERYLSFYSPERDFDIDIGRSILQRETWIYILPVQFSRKKERDGGIDIDRSILHRMAGCRNLPFFSPEVGRVYIFRSILLRVAVE